MPKLTISPEDQALIAELRAAGLDREAFDLEAAIARDQAASGRTMPLWGDPRFPAGTDSRWQHVVDSLAEFFLSDEGWGWRDAVDDGVQSTFDQVCYLARGRSKTEARKFVRSQASSIAHAQWDGSFAERIFAEFGPKFMRFADAQVSSAVNRLLRQRSIEGTAKNGYISRDPEREAAFVKCEVDGVASQIVEVLRSSGAYDIDVEDVVGRYKEYSFYVDVDWSNVRAAVIGYAEAAANRLVAEY